MGAKLLYRDAQGQDRGADIPTEGAFLGRAVDCIVRTDDAMVSRKNCKIFFLGGRWHVEDQGSANGTFVNERRIQREVIQHGDVIRCGTLQVRFVEVPGAQADSSRSSQQAPPPLPNVAGRPNESEGTSHVPQAAAERRTFSPDPEALAGGTGKQAPVAPKTDEELQKALAALADKEQQLKDAQQKLEASDQDNKRLKQDLGKTKDELSKLQRQSQQIAESLKAETAVSEDLRQEVKKLKEQHAQARAQVEDLRGQMEVKDRQLTSAQEDMRRGKKLADDLNGKLIEANRAKDEQLSAINNQRGEVDNLREILKERERMLEERKIGLMNMDAQVKELRGRCDSLEKELSQLRAERDTLRERVSRGQAQIEDLNAALAGQKEGGAQLAQLSKDNSLLRDQLQQARADLQAAQDLVHKAKADSAEAEELRARLEQLAQEKKGETERTQKAVEKARQDLRSELLARFNEERQQLSAARDAAEKKAREAAAAPAGADPAQVAALEQERDRLKIRIADAEKQAEELEARLKDASTATTAPSLSTAPDGEAARMLKEFRDLLGTACEGLNDALSELRLSIVLAQETHEKIERAMPDKDAARKVREALSQTMERAEDAKGHIRSLRSILE